MIEFLFIVDTSDKLLWAKQIATRSEPIPKKDRERIRAKVILACRRTGYKFSEPWDPQTNSILIASKFVSGNIVGAIVPEEFRSKFNIFALLAELDEEMAKTNWNSSEQAQAFDAKIYEKASKYRGADPVKKVEMAAEKVEQHLIVLQKNAEKAYNTTLILQKDTEESVERTKELKETSNEAKKALEWHYKKLTYFVIGLLTIIGLNVLLFVVNFVL